MRIENLCMFSEVLQVKELEGEKGFQNEFDLGLLGQRFGVLTKAEILLYF